jgi:hypothetical protein
MTRIERVPGCGCPARDGMIYHDRATCTDPVVARLGWYGTPAPPSTAAASSSAGDWDCEAYGPRGAEVGALCFIAPEGGRLCRSPEHCRDVMAEERQRVFNRIQRLAAAGIPDFVYLAAEFPTPDTLLGGGKESDELAG